MVSRAAPSLNLMAVGFPVILICGLLVLVVSVPQLLSGFERLLAQSFMLLQSLSGARI
jgi:flagellar biosynthetic protein FliR